jgi:hypothetical protein
MAMTATTVTATEMATTVTVTVALGILLREGGVVAAAAEVDAMALVSGNCCGLCFPTG